MKSFAILLLMLVPFYHTISQASDKAKPTPSAPQLFFEYSWLYDSNCANTPDRTIDPAWSKEAKDKAPEFARAWERLGPALYGKLFEEFGAGFQRKEMTATLSVCPTPSYSNPLVLNVTKYLKSFMAPQAIRSDDSFAALVFHELLHTWVGENVGNETALLKKYKNEAPVVRNHLHVMALQKYIYIQLGRADLQKMLSTQYETFPNPAYRRAWEIVDRIEGYENFIREIPRKK